MNRKVAAKTTEEVRRGLAEVVHLARQGGVTVVSYHGFPVFAAVPLDITAEELAQAVSEVTGEDQK